MFVFFLEKSVGDGHGVGGPALRVLLLLAEPEYAAGDGHDHDHYEEEDYDDHSSRKIPHFEAL